MTMKVPREQTLRDMNASYGGSFNMQVTRKYLKGSKLYSDLQSTLKHSELV